MANKIIFTLITLASLALVIPVALICDSKTAQNILFITFGFALLLVASTWYIGYKMRRKRTERRYIEQAKDVKVEMRRFRNDSLWHAMLPMPLLLTSGIAVLIIAFV